MKELGVKMRLGFLIDTFYISAWLYEAIEKALAVGHVMPCVLILNTKNSLDKTKANKKYKNRLRIELFNNYFLNCYLRWDKKHFMERYINKENDAYALKDIRNLMPLVPIIKMTPKQETHSDWMVQEDITSIQEFKLDVLFQVGFHPIKDDLYKVPTYGIWSYHDVKQKKCSPLGFWELFYKEGAVGVLVRFTKNTCEEEVLACVCVPTSEYSLFMTCNALAWDSSPLMQLCLNQLIKTGSPFLNGDERIVIKSRPTHSPNFFVTLLLFSKSSFLSRLYKKAIAPMPDESK